jgi:hypothetical protein
MLVAAACFIIRLKRLQALHSGGLTPFEVGELVGGLTVLPTIAVVICVCVPTLRNSRSSAVALLIAFGLTLATSLREWLLQ